MTLLYTHYLLFKFLIIHRNVPILFKKNCIVVPILKVNSKLWYNYVLILPMAKYISIYLPLSLLKMFEKLIKDRYIEMFVW